MYVNAGCDATPLRIGLPRAPESASSIQVLKAVPAVCDFGRGDLNAISCRSKAVTNLCRTIGAKAFSSRVVKHGVSQQPIRFGLVTAANGCSGPNLSDTETSASARLVVRIEREASYASNV